MPGQWTVSGAAAVEALEAWEACFSNCLEQSLDYKRFLEAVSKQYFKIPLNGQGILEAWVKSYGNLVVPDSRLSTYFEQLLHTGRVADLDVLTWLYEMFKTSLPNQDRFAVTFAFTGEKVSRTEKGWKPMVEAEVLNKMAYQMKHHRNIRIKANDTVPDSRLCKPLMACLSIFNETLAGTNPLIGPALQIGNALAKFVEAYIHELSIVGLLNCKDGSPPDDFRKWFDIYLPPFISLISPTDGELGQSLVLLQRESGLHLGANLQQIDDVMVNNLNALNYQENVLDSPVIITRAALYIYLNAMYTGRPLSDDSALYAFLNSRYNSEIPTLVTDLITASFDILANAINRTEPNESISIYRSFLTNKLPVLLESYSGMIFLPLTIEVCITEALNRMDPSADPYSTQTFDLLSSSGMLSEARQEFLFACALFSLIPEQSIEAILGDVPMQSLPESGRYVKANLVAQCSANPARIEALVGELENMEGNVSEIVAALIEIIQTLCLAKDSMTLKGVCSILSRKVQALDVIMIFAQPSAILQPLCELLDHWQDHEDQGEHHPVYDEFGSIFLLVLVFWEHFSLAESDFGISYPDSFVLKYLLAGRSPRSLDSLSEHESQMLGDWIKGLFESEAISDELMSTCNPREFYLLVSTLFDQSLQACESGVLGIDALKGGFEYLLVAFLLPSLVSGLGWFTLRLWSTLPLAPHLTLHLAVLQALLKPPALSIDSKPPHLTVLSIISKPLERSLAHVQRLHPRRSDIDPLLSLLKSRTNSQRSAQASHPELETWCSNSAAGILGALRYSFQALVAWCSTPAPTPPPPYTHRQLLAALSIRGAPSVLQALLDETLKLLLLAPAALDVLAALICAPVAATPSLTLSLRDALQTAYEDAYNISKRDEPRAELIVRLQRRVQAQTLRTAQEGDVAGEMLMMEGPGADTIDGVLKGVNEDLEVEGFLTGDGMFGGA